MMILKHLWNLAILFHAATNHLLCGKLPQGLGWTPHFHSKDRDVPMWLACFKSFSDFSLVRNCVSNMASKALAHLDPIYLSRFISARLLSHTFVDLKNSHSLEVESYVLFCGTSSSVNHISSVPKKTVLRSWGVVGRESGYTEACNKG